MDRVKVFNMSIEDIVSSAFTVTGFKYKFLPLWKVEKYGNKVKELLEKKGYKVSTLFSRYNTIKFFQEYEEVFGLNMETQEVTTFPEKEEEVVKLQAVHQYEVFMTFRDKEAIKVLEDVEDSD